MSIRKITKKQAIKLAIEDYYKAKKHNYVFNLPAQPKMGYSFARRGEIAGDGIREVWDTSKLWKPICMDTPLVLASFRGDKTETRRLAKHQPAKVGKSNLSFGFDAIKWEYAEGAIDYAMNQPPPYKPGDLLYAREKWQAASYSTAWSSIYHWGHVAIKEKKEDNDKTLVFIFPDTAPHNTLVPPRWLPSIHMPKEASRLWLEVVNCYPQFLQDITGDQCLAEGIGIHDGNCSEFEKFDTQDELYRRVFAHMWDEIAGKNGAMWADNPLVWVTEYKRVDYGPFTNGGK